MEQKKEDRRTQYSKRVIRESLYELMKEKPLNKITVREICEKADVNRSTFYAYYTDIYDLHQRIIKQFFRFQHSVIKKANGVLEKKKDITDLQVDDFYEIYYFYLETIKENKELYKFIFNQNSSQSVFVSFRKVFYHNLKQMLPEETPAKIADAFKDSFTFVNGGTTALMTQWLSTDCTSASVEKFAKQLSYFSYGVFNGYKNINQNKK